MITKSKSVKDLFEYDSKGMLVMKDKPSLLWLIDWLLSVSKFHFIYGKLF